MKRKQRSRKYCAPFAKVASVTFESNFCQTMRLNIQVEELQHMNLSVDDERRDTDADPFYFEL